jgi:hypothetical protein
MNRKRWLVRLALVAVLGVAMLVWSLSQRAQPRLAIENRSEQPIRQLRVTVDNKTHKFTNVPHRGEVTVPLGTQSDVPCVVQGELEDGSIIRQQFFHPVSGTLVIRPRGETQFHPLGKG